MTNLFARETYVNATKGYRFGGTPWYETYTDDRGELYRSLQREYGRCACKIYADRPGAPLLPVGWIFRQHMEYEGYCGHGERYYNREVWVEISEQPQPFGE